MKAIQQKLDQNKQKLGVIYSYNEHIINIGDLQEIKQLQQSLENTKSHKKKQSYAEKQQNISILQISKPIIEFDIQISRNYSDKMIIFIDSVPEELVEEFIVYNHMKPQSFSPILQSVLEKMIQIVNERDICFVNLRDDKYYQVLMKKQQQYCQELQYIKDMIHREKQRGEQLLNMKLSRTNIQPEKRDVASQSPPQKERYEQKQVQNSLKSSVRGMNQRSPQQDQSNQYLQNSFQQINQINQTPPNQIESELNLEDQPLQVFYDHLNPQNKHNIHDFYNLHKNGQKQRSATPTTNRTLENSKKMEKRTPSTSPPPSQQLNRSKTNLQLKFKKNDDKSRERSNSPAIQKSPLKYPNEESYREKSDKRKKYYNQQGELVDPMEVSKRLHKQKKESPCPRHEPKQDFSEKECTFKPQINENSRILSKIYNQKQNAKPKQGKENEASQSQLDRSKSKGAIKNKNNKGNGEEESQGDDTTIYQIVNSEQLKQSNQNQTTYIKEDFQNDQQNQTQNIFQSPQYKSVQEFQYPTQKYMNTSPRENNKIYPQYQFTYMPQNQNINNVPVYEKQINIKEEIIYQYPENMYKPQRVSKLKQLQEHSVQTSEQLMFSNNGLSENTASVPFDPNLNKNYFKYLDMKDEMEKEQQQNTEDIIIHHSFSNQPQQPPQPLKKSFGMQTSEQIQQSKFNKSSSIQTSGMNTDRQPVEFNPNLNKNYFKFLQMEEDLANEKGQKSQFTPQQSAIIQSKALPNFQSSFIPQPQIVEKKTVSLQTSEYLMFLKSQQKSEKEIQSTYSQEETPKQFVPFDPNLNKNYFKFLQMEEEKQKDEDVLHLQIQSYGQSKNQSIASSQQSYNHINRKKYEEETPKQSNQTSIQDSNINKNYFKSNVISDNNDAKYVFKLEQQDEQVPQVKTFPEDNNSIFKRSPRSYNELSPNKQQNSSITSNPGLHGENSNFEINGSVYYCDEDPITLQSDDPFRTNSQKQIQMQQNNNKINDDFRTNLHKSNFTKPKDSQIKQKPDITISSVRSVSPRIDKASSNIQDSISPRNNFQLNYQTSGQGQNNNIPKLHSNGLQINQQSSNIYLSKSRGQLSGIELEAFEEVFKTMRKQQKGILFKKQDIDFYNLPFEVVLRSHIQIILQTFKDNEEITLQGFFQALEKCNNINLFLAECVEFYKKNNQN